MDVDCGRQTSRGRGVGSMRTDADKEGGGSKIGKILRTSFMYDPLRIDVDLLILWQYIALLTDSVTFVAYI